jgi:hypothetical protein
VLDADGSQTLAIQTVREGRDLVIQGPPGRGKSQTIANIVAAAAHDGKSVLFIAEKMVALKVVHDRLKNAGLGALCLQLHSNKANKRDLVAELKQTLSAGAVEPGLAEVTPRLTESRDALNRIARDLYAPIGATGASAFRAIADLIRAKGLGLPPPSYSVPEMASWTNSDYETVLEAAEIYARTTQTSGSWHSHPWRGVRNAGLEPTDLDRITESGPSPKLQTIPLLCSRATGQFLWPVSGASNASSNLSLAPLKAAPKRWHGSTLSLHLSSLAPRR